MAPLGADLTVDDLLTALKWKLETEHDAHQTEDFTDLQRTNCFSKWTRRTEDSNHVTSLIGRRLNILPMVNRLPVEILQEIFLVLKHENPNTSFQLPPTKSDLTGANLWVKVTHVCHHWRSTAHKTRALWRRISIGKGLKFPASLASFFFKLSYPLPIKLEQHFGPKLPINEEEKMNQFYSSLLDQPHRISALYLRGHLPSMAWKLLQDTLPNIVEVDVVFNQMVRSPFSEDAYVLRNREFENFLGGNPSVLQKLSLEDYTWPRVTFPVLTHLYLTDESYANPVNEDEFFDILRSLSSTLQFLYLEDSTPILEDPDNYKIFYPATRICMLALRHLEIHVAQPPDDQPNCALMHLQNLSLPSIETMFWNLELTDKIDFHDPTSRWGMSMVPPAEYLARVTSVVGRALREGCYTLSGNTLYFDLASPGIYTLNYWQPHLPNVVTLALPPGHAEFITFYGRWGVVQRMLMNYTTIKSLHICSTSRVELIILLFALEKNTLGSGFFPHFQTLVVYVGESSLQCMERNTSEDLAKNALQRIQLSADNSMVRTRPHPQTTYTLHFKMGDIEGFTGDELQ